MHERRGPKLYNAGATIDFCRFFSHDANKFWMLGNHGFNLLWPIWLLPRKDIFLYEDNILKRTSAAIFSLEKRPFWKSALWFLYDPVAHNATYHLIAHTSPYDGPCTVHRTFTNYTIFTSKLILGQYLVLEHKLSATYGVLQTHVRATHKYVWTIEFCTFYFFGRIIILSVHKLHTSYQRSLLGCSDGQFWSKRQN